MKKAVKIFLICILAVILYSYFWIQAHDIHQTVLPKEDIPCGAVVYRKETVAAEEKICAEKTGKEIYDFADSEAFYYCLMNNYNGKGQNFSGEVTFKHDKKYYIPLYDVKSLNLTADICLDDTAEAYVIYVIYEEKVTHVLYAEEADERVQIHTEGNDMVIQYSYEQEKYGKNRKYSLDLSVHFKETQ